MDNELWYFTKPAPVTCTLARQPGQAQAPTMVYEVEDFLAEFSWNVFTKWNEEESWGQAQVRISEAVEATEVGERVVLTRADVEKLRTSLKEAKLQGRNVGKIRRFQFAVLAAQRLPDEPKAKGAPKK